MADATSSHMIDTTGKAPSRRMAIAEARVNLSVEARAALAQGTLPKGRAEEVARIAGVMAAKKCSDLIPFCHPIGISYAEVEIVPTDEGVCIRATTRAEAPTGVEMEALVAVTTAALTIYDMCKTLDPGATIVQVRVVSKRGGKSGDWGEDAGGDG